MSAIGRTPATPSGRGPAGARALGILLSAVVVLLAVLAGGATARAVEAVPVPQAVPAIDLLPFTERLVNGAGERLQVSTAPGADGIVRRIEVRPQSPETTHWAVIALSNPGDEQIDRLLVVPRYRLVDSGFIWPDLGSARIRAITPSQGFPPRPLQSLDADVYEITLDPGAIVTFVVELASPGLPQLRLWEPNAYRDSLNAYTLYKGIVLGIAALIAVFFTLVVLLKGTLMFAATAALAWVVLGVVLIDMSFLAEVLRSRVEEEIVFRAIAETLLALTLALFVYAYLNLNRWHVRYAHAILALGVLFVGVLVLAIWDPPIAAGIARVSLGVVGLAGLVLIGAYALKGYDRAIMLIPTWCLFLVWLVGAGLAVTGRIDNDIVQPALDGGLILITLLVGFTVLQHAFAGAAGIGGVVDDAEQRALALAGSGDILWDWDVARDRITCGVEAELWLGLPPGTLQGAPQKWLPVLHPQDRDRFRATLDTLIEQRRGRISDLFRFRGVDGHYRWFRLRARPVLGSDGEIVRCCGTLLDFTEAKTIEERLLQDSVYDNLTGLPNRYLFMDRVEMARAWANETTADRLFVVVANLDKFSDVNDEFGLSVGDSILLTIARRLGRILKAHDSLARLPGDAFAMLVYLEPSGIEAFVDQVRRQIRVGIEFGDREIFVTASLGIASIKSEGETPEELLENADLAMRRAKRQGGDRGEVFDPLMRRLNMSGRSLARDLKKAVEASQVRIEYRPVMRLDDKHVVALEMMPSWHHPLQGPLAWRELLATAEKEGLSASLTLNVLERAAHALSRWQEDGAQVSLFAPIPIAAPFRSELIGDVKAVIARANLPAGALQLAVAETVVADNPEFAVQLMRRLRDAGAGVWIDGFGKGATWLGYLERLPIDGIRYDESLTGGRAQSRRTRILKPLVAIADELDVTTMASSVDTPQDAIDLYGAGIELATGALFGRTVGVQGVPQLLSSYATAAE